MEGYLGLKQDSGALLWILDFIASTYQDVFHMQIIPAEIVVFKSDELRVDRGCKEFVKSLSYLEGKIHFFKNKPSKSIEYSIQPK